MIAATLLAVAREMLPENEAARIIGLVSRVGPRPPLPRIPARRMLEIMRADKKTRGGHLRFGLPRRIGRVEGVDDVPAQSVTTGWRGLRPQPPPDVLAHHHDLAYLPPHHRA